MSFHGSSLPQNFEGAPFHDDAFMVSFNVEADTNGVFPYAGALVTLATDADQTCKISLTGTDFILGVCEESGILQGQINVILRGLITVTTDAAVTPGLYLTFSATHDGQVGLTASSGTTVSRLIAIQTADGSVTAAPVLALLIA